MALIQVIIIDKENEIREICVFHGYHKARKYANRAVKRQPGSSACFGYPSYLNEEKDYQKELFEILKSAFQGGCI